MNKSTKGALAAGAAGVLLLGGASSLAFWTDSDAVAGGTFTAGSLNLTPLNGCNVWNLDTGEPGGQPFDPATGKIVPGDVITKVCTFTIDAVGTHLRAGVVAEAGTDSGDLIDSGDLTVGTAALTIAGNPITEITAANNTQTLSVTVPVTFNDPGVSDNTTQTLSGTLDAINIVTTQVHN
jgi:alternate signal-mediated exported protein